ncbi:MAG: hypothetical protein KAR19_09165 [Bacteroidales bacterium]|nr:hypothetical protein [Bacteroidales bacterium]
MRYMEFREALITYPVFSYPDILKIDPGFDRRRLVEWQVKNHIQKIRNGYYRFQGGDLSESYHMYISNRIYRPSYISLESALSYYNLIPEAVFIYTGVSTRKTIMFETSLGNYNFRSIKNGLFFGFNLIQLGGYKIRIADPEKAVLDFLYFNKISDMDMLDGLRINRLEARELIQADKLIAYLALYSSYKMEQRIELFLEYIDAEP